ncbi:MAG TPA: HlyD family secretion protein [Gemmatimonadales bacterium]|nr:HlyD family secretion protein [Gemmatimonadales bacterium]
MTDGTDENPAEIVEPRPKRRRIPVIVVGVLALALAVWGLNRYLYSRHHVSTDNAQIDGHITLIAPRIAAFVTRILVDDNQHVQAGDTLVVLDDRDLKVRLQQAEADLHEAEAAVSSRGRAGQTQAQLQATRAEAASAQASVSAAEADYHKAAADVERYRKLAAQKIVSAQQFDAAEAAAAQAAAKLEAARRQAAAAGSQVSASGAAVRSADARLAAAQAAVSNAGLQLSYAYITAPVAGIVAKRNAEIGALVQVGQTLMSIVPDENVWVTANLKETQLTHVRVGDRAEFTVDAYPGRSFEGRVESLSPATGARFALLPPDNATGNFTKVVQRIPVRIAVDQPAGSPVPLRPGMSVDVTIETGRNNSSAAATAATK